LLAIENFLNILEDILQSVGLFDMNVYPDEIFKFRILIKVTKSEYVNDLLNGNLYMNSFYYFREIEEKTARGDELEGVDAGYRAEDITLRISDGKGTFLPIKELVGRSNFHNNHVINSNLFSISGFSLEDFPIGQSNLFLDQKFREFGDKSVIIYDVPRFISMIERGFEKIKE
ncbi:TPA: hypothetical protein K1Y44_003019, partial [Legionella pneumophila]|nr:hypothetical protein [Legionella pneumophila]